MASFKCKQENVICTFLILFLSKRCVYILWWLYSCVSQSGTTKPQGSIKKIWGSGKYEKKFNLKYLIKNKWIMPIPVREISEKISTPKYKSLCINPRLIIFSTTITKKNRTAFYFDISFIVFSHINKFLLFRIFLNNFYII